MPTYPPAIEQDSLDQDSLKSDTLDLPYEPSRQPDFYPEDRFGDPFIYQPSISPLILRDPSNLSLDIEIDTANE